VVSLRSTTGYPLKTLRVETHYGLPNANITTSKLERRAFTELPLAGASCLLPASLGGRDNPPKLPT